MLSQIYVNADVAQARESLMELELVSTCEAASAPLEKFWSAYYRLQHEDQTLLQEEVRSEKHPRAKDFFDF